MTAADEDLPITLRSAYRVMWMMVMFDLPVVEDEQRKEATRFRQRLLDLGFSMAQFSVYMRCCVSRERTEAILQQVRANLPQGGKVGILFFTDKQYANMLHFFSRQEAAPPPDTGQLALF